MANKLYEVNVRYNKSGQFDECEKFKSVTNYGVENGHLFISYDGGKLHRTINASSWLWYMVEETEVAKKDA